jgi:hypothetical protein
LKGGAGMNEDLKHKVLDLSDFFDSIFKDNPDQLVTHGEALMAIRALCEFFFSVLDDREHLSEEDTNDD